MVTEFTPYLSLLGGGLIGLAATSLMLFLGRVYGATGVLAGLVAPVSGDWAWRAALIAGMVSGPLLFRAITGDLPVINVPSSWPMFLAGGLLVGIGVTFGSGCTSGHGVCGLARLSRRSVVATVMFMTTAGLTVFAVRHLIGA